MRPSSLPYNIEHSLLLEQALPHDLICQHACCHRGVEGINIAVHRDRSHKIAALFHQTADPFALISYDKTDRTGQIQAVHTFPAHIGTDKPQALLF